MEHLETTAIATVLTVDDDTRLQEGLQDFFQHNGFKYHSLFSGKALDNGMELYNPDVILLDVMLPGEDGFSILRRIRMVSSVPVIMLTARGEDMDRIVGLEMGADDYLSKPFNPRELLARIKAVLRRSAPAAEPAPVSAESLSRPVRAFVGVEVACPPHRLDGKLQTLFYNEARVKLSTAELGLFHAFMTHPDEVLTREQLQVLAFGRDTEKSVRKIDVHVSRLRGILKELGDAVDRIKTVWGTGYCWMSGE
ncbi:response regulator [Desulfovibrio sp. OttesenSCG-928-G15]|nr:response regulator [Desulfovibrio sp. OttesenSCG-928-G15]